MVCQVSRSSNRLTPACAGSTRWWTPRRWSPSTHPRVCGEHATITPHANCRNDSPPRVRGARPPTLARRAPRRLTPACAGSTPRRCTRSSWRPTHPRVCGEHLDAAARHLLMFDSPPRVRGAPGRSATRPAGHRLTPACAGSTRRPRQSVRLRPTHPRVCGEHHDPASFSEGYADSPPRVRGARSARVRLRQRRLGCRLTPACAGSTMNMMRSHRFNPTHPRVCGEHVLARCRSRCAGDSPPRVRGAPDLGSADAGRIRLTPACAGSTSSLRDFLYRQPTHPRVCGEHGQGSPSRFTGIDSPPRVRGALAAARRRRYERRLTPACAGSTLNQRRRLSPSTTHPRVCGEHTLNTNRQFIPVDSPPRVRGARGFGASVLSQGRLTPACAGSTPPERPRRASQATHPRVCGEHLRRGPATR